LLIDAQRRSGNQIQVEELTRPDALVTLIESLYFASADAGMWRASFEVLRMIVSKVPVGRATIPASLPALQSAVASYREAGPR
jgi:hypothetical protein